MNAIPMSRTNKEDEQGNSNVTGTGSPSSDQQYPLSGTTASYLDADDESLGRARQQLVEQLIFDEENNKTMEKPRNVPVGLCYEAKLEPQREVKRESPKQGDTTDFVGRAPQKEGGEKPTKDESQSTETKQKSTIDICDEEMGLPQHTKHSTTETGSCISDDDSSIHLPGDVYDGVPGAIAVFPTRLPTSEQDDPSVQHSNPGCDSTSQTDLQDCSASTAVIAVTVDDDIAEIEERVRNLILEEAVEASAVPAPPVVAPRCLPRPCLLLGLATLMIAVAVAILATWLASSSRNNGPLVDFDDIMPATDPQTAEHVSTLEAVRKRGTVRCGLYEDFLSLSSYNDETGKLEGFNVDQCRALSLAVFGTPDNIEPVPVLPINRFWLLANRSIDVITQTVTHTMGRDIYEPSAKSGFTFSTPYFYSGMGYAGVPEMVTCAERYSSGEEDLEGCEYLRICVGVGTTHPQRVSTLVPDQVEVHTYVNMADAMNKYVYGQCNVFAGEPISMSEKKLRQLGYIGEYKMGEELFSREPLALVTNDHDPEWSALVNAVVNIFFVAEAKGVTIATVEEATWEWSDPDLMDVATSIVSYFGNYGELYEKHLEGLVPRSGLNTLYRDQDSPETGLLYSMPYGNIDSLGPGPTPGQTMDAILRRDHIRCGIRSRPGFAGHVGGSWIGFDVDMCRLIAAGLFGEADGHVSFVEVLADTLGFLSLLNGELDVIVGNSAPVAAMYKEPSTGHPFQFSPSYLYDLGKSYVMVTKGNDSQWSAFVYWVVMATIHSEDHSLTQESVGPVPTVQIFGEGLSNLFQNLISGVGSYEDMYDRNLGSLMPRSSKNQINFQGPQQYPLPLL